MNVLSLEEPQTNVFCAPPFDQQLYAINFTENGQSLKFYVSLFFTET